MDAAVLRQLVDPLNPARREREEGWPHGRSEKQHVVGVGCHLACMNQKKPASATVPKAAQDRNHKSR